MNEGELAEWMRDPAMQRIWKRYGAKYPYMTFVRNWGVARRNGGRFMRPIRVLLTVNKLELAIEVDPQDQAWLPRMLSDVAAAVNSPGTALEAVLEDGTLLTGARAEITRLATARAHSIEVRPLTKKSARPAAPLPPRPTYPLPLMTWEEVERERARARAAQKVRELQERPGADGGRSSADSKLESERNFVVFAQYAVKLIEQLRQVLIQKLPSLLAEIPESERDVRRVQELVLATLMAPSTYGSEAKRDEMWTALGAYQGMFFNELSQGVAAELVEHDLGGDREIYKTALVGCSIWDDLVNRAKAMRARRRRCAMNQPRRTHRMTLLCQQGSARAEAICAEVGEELIGQRPRRRAVVVATDEAPDAHSIACAKRHACYVTKRTFALPPNASVSLLPSYAQLVKLTSVVDASSSSATFNPPSGALVLRTKGSACAARPTLRLVRAQPHELMTGVPEGECRCEEDGRFVLASGDGVESAGDRYSDRRRAGWLGWERNSGRYRVGHSRYLPPPYGYRPGWRRRWVALEDARAWYEWERLYGRFRPGMAGYVPPPPGYYAGWRDYYQAAPGAEFFPAVPLYDAPPGALVAVPRRPLFSLSVGEELAEAAASCLECGSQLDAASEPENCARCGAGLPWKRVDKKNKKSNRKVVDALAPAVQEEAAQQQQQQEEEKDMPPRGQSHLVVDFGRRGAEILGEAASSARLRISLIQSRPGEAGEKLTEIITARLGPAPDFARSFPLRVGRYLVEVIGVDSKRIRAAKVSIASQRNRIRLGFDEEKPSTSTVQRYPRTKRALVSRALADYLNAVRSSSPGAPRTLVFMPSNESYDPAFAQRLGEYTYSSQSAIAIEAGREYLTRGGRSFRLSGDLLELQGTRAPIKVEAIVDLSEDFKDGSSLLVVVMAGTADDVPRAAAAPPQA